MNITRFLQELQLGLPTPKGIYHNITHDSQGIRLNVYVDGIWHSFEASEPLTETDLTHVLEYFV